MICFCNKFSHVKITNSKVTVFIFTDYVKFGNKIVTKHDAEINGRRNTSNK